MKTLLYLLFTLPTIVARATPPPDAADVVFPATPQIEREIKMNGKPSIRGKLLLYAPARIHIEKADGSLVAVPPLMIDRAELNHFPNTVLAPPVDSSTEVIHEEAAKKFKRTIETLEEENRANRQELTRLFFENEALKQTNARFTATFVKSVERKSSLPAPNSPSRPAAPEVRWRQLAKYTGIGGQSTAPFTITGSEWRLRWTCSAQDVFGGFLSVSSRGTDNILLVNIPEPGSDTSYVRGKGRFSLEVTSTGMAWTLIVEEAAP